MPQHINTLQDVLDEVNRDPTIYGHSAWFAGGMDNEPVCPLAKLVIKHHDTNYDNAGNAEYVREAADLLNVTQEVIGNFMEWWDFTCTDAYDSWFRDDSYARERAEKARAALIEQGYTVPSSLEIRERRHGNETTTV